MEEVTNKFKLKAGKKEIVKTEYLSQKGQKIILREKRITYFVWLETITHLVCDCYLTTVYTNNGDNYVIAKLLKEFETELSSFGFVRVNRNTLINSIHLASYSNMGNRSILLSNNVTIEISRRGMTRLKAAIGL